MLFASACSGDQTPFESYDEDGYKVSGRFEANGGAFTTNVSVVTDFYDISTMTAGADGKISLPLIAPTDAGRGESNYYTPTLEDHFLVGWYGQRTEASAGEGYTYSDRWDFASDKLVLDPNGSYQSSQPVKTLYAAWAPMLQVAVYDRATGTLIDTVSYDPNVVESLDMPHWNEEKGIMEMEDIPGKSGYTFDAAYYDKEGTQPITTEKLVHTAVIDRATGVVTGAEMAIYVDWVEGEWYRISTVEQFIKNASVRGHYEILADLDFSDSYWPSVFLHSNFTGTIHGNGHTFSNISATQTQANNKKNYSGLFGNVTGDAVIKDLTLENVTFMIEGGTMTMGANFGLFAGVISTEATIENVQILDSTLQISSKIYYNKDSDYFIGRVCAIGYDTAGISAAGIAVEAVNEVPSQGATTYKVVQITEVDDNLIEVEVVTMTVDEST